MSNERGVVQTYVLGIAEDTASTNKMITLSRITHWVCFLLALGAIIKFSTLYFGRGDMWNEPPDRVPDRMLLQLTANSLLWLFVSGLSLIAGIIAWLNTDVLMNRKMLLELRAIVSQSASTAPQAVVQTGAATSSATSGTETPTAAGT